MKQSGSLQATSELEQSVGLVVRACCLRLYVSRIGVKQSRNAYSTFDLFQLVQQARPEPCLEA